MKTNSSTPNYVHYILSVKPIEPKKKVIKQKLNSQMAIIYIKEGEVYESNKKEDINLQIDSVHTHKNTLDNGMS